MKILTAVTGTWLLLSALASCHSSPEPEGRFISTANMDSTVKPGDNFYQFVNGRWMKTATIPPTESSAGAFLDLYNLTKERIHIILDSVAKTDASGGGIARKVGDFYASGMDSATIEKLGYEPLKPLLQQIAGLKDAKGIMQFVAEQAKAEDDYLIAPYIGADDKNSSLNIAAFYQSGLGLPDRDYYFKTDPATARIQQAYRTYIRTIFTLTGDDSITASKKVTAVYNLEKTLAGSHRTNVELRDPQSNYHKMAVADLDKQMPAIGWKGLFGSMGFKTDSVNLQQPAYYIKLNEQLTATPIDTWKAYLFFHAFALNSMALSSPFVNAQFVYRQSITGSKQIRPRWERIYGLTDANLGEALGEIYVKRYFPEEAKKRMEELVNNLQKAFEGRIKRVDWMSDSTKQVAIDKLHTFIKKIGYPDKWRDYSKVSIHRDQFYNNLVSCGQNDFQYQLDKLGKKVDRTEWGMTPPTINAYYNPTFNEIVFPAGILQPPFFSDQADDAINYGGIGAVIGHEMTHGFDDQGSQYDKEGNLKNWWAPKDSSQFVARTKKIIDQYNGYTVLDTLHLNGALTTGENSADLGGLSIAYDAFKLTPEGKDTTRIDGFTPDQRFFINYAQVWREKMTDELTRTLALGNPHSPGIYRVNGPLSNFDPFYKAFNLQPGNKMYKPENERLKIW